MSQNKTDVRVSDDKREIVDTEKLLDDLSEDELLALTGVGQEDLARVLLSRIGITHMGTKDFVDGSAEAKAQSRRVARAVLGGLAPQNTVQAMLATQMAAVHNVQLQCAVLAKHASHPDNVRSYVNMTTKLSNTFVQQATLLNKLQGKGQQKVTVEHVNVHAGGQAVVGNVDNSTHIAPGGEKNDEKK